MNLPAAQEFSRRELFVRSAKRGLVAAVAIAGAGVAGNKYGANQEREKHVGPGDLTPELRAKLEDAGLFVTKIPADLTIENLREAGLDILPLTVPEGQPNAETVASKRKWMAVKPEEFYLPASKENPTLSDLNTLVTRKSTAMRSLNIDSGIQVVSGSPAELAWLDFVLRLQKRKGLINGGEGFIVTGTKIKIDGKDNGVAIGRSAPGEPLSIVTFDASTQNPTPPTGGFRAAGIVVAR
ncbi:MAG: hypothetical protein HY428_01825 [Candidatus Levybacteria bacterium]|nr:hypothetical protein [Candidatus Levybacteria bacterium]